MQAYQLLTPTIKTSQRTADNTAQVLGSPLCLDPTEVAAGTSARGMTISNTQAVASFVEKPAIANAPFHIGVAREAMAIGDQRPIIECGPARVRVNNPSAADLVLAVGDMLVQVPGQNYYQPVFQNVTAAGAVAVAAGCGMARVFVRKVQTIATTITALVEAYVFPPAAPQYHSSTHLIPGAISGGIAAAPFWIAPGPGKIIRAGLGAATGGGAGELSLDILKNTVSVFSVLPSIEDDMDDPCHTLTDVIALDPGTGGDFGTLLTTVAAHFVQNDIFTMTLANTNVFVGTNVQVQMDVLLY